MSKTTALAIANKQNLTPKPTKSEIIEAMVKRAVVKIKAENDANSKKRDVIIAKIKKSARKLAKSIQFEVNIYGNSRTPHVNMYSGDVTSPELDKLLAEYNACKHQVIDEKELRNQIRSELNGAMKPDPDRLLNDPSTVKAIDAQLAAWGIN
jgi:hypothetical protein